MPNTPNTTNTTPKYSPKHNPTKFNQAVIKRCKLRRKARNKRRFTIGSFAAAAFSLLAAPLLLAPSIFASPSSSLSSSTSPRYATSLEEVAQSVWQIKHNRGHGSGTVISCTIERRRSIKVVPSEDGKTNTTIVIPRRYRVLILTAYHVVDHLEERVPLPELNARNIYGDKLLIDGAVIYVHDYTDAAVLSFYSYDYCPPVRLAEKLPKLGERLYSIGYGGGSGAEGSIWISEGLYSGEEPGGEEGRLTTYAVPGDSGGVVINKQGEIVATVIALEVGRSPVGPFPTALHCHVKVVLVEPMLDWLILSLYAAKIIPHPEPRPEPRPEPKPEPEPKSDPDSDSEPALPFVPHPNNVPNNTPNKD